jgi:uncharacterized protein YggU (UPF0235/DUF167 family)
LNITLLDLQPHPHGTILPVRAHAGARRNGVQGASDGMLKISVTQAPEKGKANKALIAVIAKALDVRKSQIELLSGETSSRKKFLLRDLDLEEARQRVADALAQS